MAEKTEKKSGGGQIIKLALVLFAVSAIMALALSLVYEVTKDTIAMRAAETTKNAYANVLQADDYAEQADFENDGTITKLSVATTGGEQTGYVAETTFSGAQGSITMAVGVDTDYKCTGISIISNPISQMVLIALSIKTNGSITCQQDFQSHTSFRNLVQHQFLQVK